MKKKTFTGKLSLNKETVSKLNDSQMDAINGGINVQIGIVFTSILSCRTNERTCDLFGTQQCEVNVNSTPQNLKTCVGPECLTLQGC